MTKPLVLIGYWKEDGEEFQWPDPARRIKKIEDPSLKARIVAYLRAGVRIHEDLGFSYCRLPGGPPDEQMGNCDMTDGTWLWPEGFHVYVDRFDVEVPAEFLEHNVDSSFWLAGAQQRA